MQHLHILLQGDVQGNLFCCNRVLCCRKIIKNLLHFTGMFWTTRRESAPKISMLGGTRETCLKIVIKNIPGSGWSFFWVNLETVFFVMLPAQICNVSELYVLRKSLLNNVTISEIYESNICLIRRGTCRIPASVTGVYLTSCRLSGSSSPAPPYDRSHPEL